MFLRSSSIHPVLHGNPNGLYHCNSLLFCSAVFYFHSGVHQNQTICHLTLTNKILVAGWIFHIFLKEFLIFSF